MSEPLDLDALEKEIHVPPSGEARLGHYWLILTLRKALAELRALRRENEKLSRKSDIADGWSEVL